MKLPLVFTVAFGLAFRSPAAGDATPEQVAAGLARRALTDANALEIVTSLTTEVGPRSAGSAAEKRAAVWAQRTFTRLGFDKVWVENFPITNGWARGMERAEVTSPAPQPLVVTALGGSVATPAEGIEAEIALFPTYDELLAAPEGSLRGRIAVVTQRMARTEDASAYGFAVRMRGGGASEAARRGAIGFLCRSVGTDHHRLAHTGVMHYTTNANVPRIPAAALSVPDAEQLERLAALGPPVRVKLVLTPRQLGAVGSQNVIGEITGRERPDEIVLLGAHLDSWDLGTGALDDGAGVAIILAAARLIHELPQRPRRTIRVVLYGAEEIGLLGGKAYVAAHKDELNHYVVVTEPDDGQGPVYRFRTGVGDVAEPTLKKIQAALAPLGVIPGANDSTGSSDVEPLAEAGVPAASLDLDGSDYFDYHHTPDDTLDKVQAERLNQSTAAHAVFAYLAAECGGNYRAGKK